MLISRPTSSVESATSGGSPRCISNVKQGRDWSGPSLKGHSDPRSRCGSCTRQPHSVGGLPRSGRTCENCLVSPGFLPAGWKWISGSHLLFNSNQPRSEQRGRKKVSLWKKLSAFHADIHRHDRRKREGKAALFHHIWSSFDFELAIFCMGYEI